MKNVRRVEPRRATVERAACRRCNEPNHSRIRDASIFQMPHTAARHITEKALQIRNIGTNRLFRTVLLITQKTLKTVQGGRNTSPETPSAVRRRAGLNPGVHCASVGYLRRGCGYRSPAGSRRSIIPVLVPVFPGSRSGFQPSFRAGGRGSCVPPFVVPALGLAALMLLDVVFLFPRICR